MRKVTFQGQEYEVPEWVKFIAKDSNGEVFGYEFRPERNIKNGYYNAYASGSGSVYLGNVDCIEL